MHFTGSPPHRRMVSFSTGTKRVTYSRKSPWHSQRTLLQADLCWLGVYLGRCAVYNPKAETELFEKRSANYSELCGSPTAGGISFCLHHVSIPHGSHAILWSMLIDGGRFQCIVESPWNKAFFRQHRKTSHQYFQPRAIPAYQEIQLEATATLLRQLLEAPDNFIQHVRHSVVVCP